MDQVLFLYAGEQEGPDLLLLSAAAIHGLCLPVTWAL